MEYYWFAALVAFVLFGMGLFALVTGYNNFRENKSSKSNQQMFLVCICVFAWDFGYAWMSMCYNSDFAYIPRAIALLGVYLYIVFINLYVSAITNYPLKKLIPFMVVLLCLSIFSWPKIIGRDAVTFTVTPWGYWYYSKMSIYRIIQFISVILGMAQYYGVVVYGFKRAKVKRERIVLKRFTLFGPVLFTGYLFDTLIPSLFRTPAIPGSGIAAFIAAMILFHIANINRMQGLSKENVSQYVFDDVKVPVIITDVDNKIVLCNDYTYDFLGVDKHDLSDSDIMDYCEESGENTFYIKHQSGRNEFADYSSEFGNSVIRKEFIPDTTTIEDQFGDKLYNIYFIRDITEERKAFKLMQKSKEEAEIANRAKSDFLANMSHEIRTPMNAIIGMSQIVLENKELPEGIKSQVNEIRIAGTNLLGIINDILDMSKIEAGRVELIEEYYDLPVLVHEVNSVVSARLKDSVVKFVLEVDPSLPRCLTGDVGRIRQILMNVIGNAIKFTKEGQIKLKISWNHYEEAPDIIFDVSDTGIGIKPEDMEKIFGKYDQVDTKRNRNIQGTGLGLAISRNLAILMGGMISVESVYGKGSTFHIIICQEISGEYVAIGEKTAEELKSKSFIIPIVEEVVPTDKSNLKVLVVDDSRVNLIVATGLMKKYGMKIDTAMSGKEAIEKVKTTDYDIVFMDHMMPEMDGVEAMRAIHDLGDKYKDLTIVALTANALSESKDALMADGFNDFLAKPIDIVELDRVLNQWG